MLASADLKVGKRRLITYFTNPILKSLSSAMREPDWYYSLVTLTVLIAESEWGFPWQSI